LGNIYQFIGQSRVFLLWSKNPIVRNSPCRNICSGVWRHVRLHSSAPRVIVKIWQQKEDNLQVLWWTIIIPATWKTEAGLQFGGLWGKVSETLSEKQTKKQKD
jgi:hypothetical protein